VYAKILLFFGSVREQRSGFRVAKWIESGLTSRGHTVHIIDPLEHVELLVIKRMFKSEKNPSEEFKKLQSLVASADGYIAVTPEYNHSFSGAIKNALDVFLEEYFFKPFGIVTYSAGGFGGIRAAEALRCVIAELGAVSIPISIPVSRVTQAIDENGTLLDESYKTRVQRFFDEFEWYVSALEHQRSQGVPY